jgi:hypothetical protein
MMVDGCLLIVVNLVSVNFLFVYPLSFPVPTAFFIIPGDCGRKKASFTFLPKILLFEQECLTRNEESSVNRYQVGGA